MAKYPGSNCTNSRWPDVHGHYREAKYSQTKHHWWWKLNWIFQHLTITKYFTGHVLFIEEDHYLAPDFLLLLDMMKYYQEHTYTEVVTSYTKLLTKNSFSFQTDILSLGTYLRKFNSKSRGRKNVRTDVETGLSFYFLVSSQIQCVIISTEYGRVLLKTDTSHPFPNG